MGIVYDIHENSPWKDTTAWDLVTKLDQLANVGAAERASHRIAVELHYRIVNGIRDTPEAS